MGDSFCLLQASFFLLSTMVNLLVREIPYFIISMEGQTMPDHLSRRKSVFSFAKSKVSSLLGFGLEFGESSHHLSVPKKTAFFFCVESVAFFEREMGCFRKILSRCFLCKLYTSINI